MTKVATVNTQPVNGVDTFYRLLGFLRDTMGFTITISGDGLAAYDNTGTTVITGFAAGANGLGNVGAYFVAQDPNGEYEWCFRNENADHLRWGIYYSALDGFTGGNATTRPTATDEQQLWTSFFLPADGTYRTHYIGDDAPVGSAVEAWGWYMVIYDSVAGRVGTWLGHEPMRLGSYPELVGTRAVPTSGEPDPTIAFVGSAANVNPLTFTPSAGGWAAGASSPAWSWYAMNGSNGNTEGFARQFGFPNPSGTGVLWPGGSGVDARDGSDPIYPVVIGRNTSIGSQIGQKGICNFLKCKGVLSRSYPDTVDIGTSRYMYAADFAIPFPDGLAPLT